MKNTMEPKTITSKNATGRFARGVLIFSIAMSIFSAEKKYMDENNQTNVINLESEEYDYYNNSFLRNLREINHSEKDDRFEEIYDKAIIIFNNKQYESAAIYIAKLEDGTVHFIDSNNNKVDLITGELLKSKRVNTLPWIDSSIFYEMYKLGLITEEKVTLSDNIIDMISKWDGEKHYQTVKQIAEKKASEEYKKRYGGK